MAALICESRQRDVFVCPLLELEKRANRLKHIKSANVLKLTGKTREGFVRTLLMGFEPQLMPSQEYFDYIRALWLVVNNLDDLFRIVARKDEELGRKLRDQFKELLRITEGLQFIHANKKSEERKAVI